MSDLPKYTHRHTDRHGVTRIYFKKPRGSSTRLFGEPGTPEFRTEYDKALASENRLTADRVKVERPEKIVIEIPTKTLGWLVKQYCMSPVFRELAQSTRTNKMQVLEHCLAEPIAPGSEAFFRDLPLDRLLTKAVKILRDRKSSLPGSANSRLKILRAMFSWAIDAEVADDLLKFNPARDVKRLKKPNAGGYHAWSIEEIEQYEEHHAVGTTARLALALLLYTGQRRSDVVRLGRPMVKKGWLYFTQHKNRVRKPNDMEIPIIPELQRIIDKSLVGTTTFLVTSFGKPFSSAGFGNKMREWCDEAGLPKCASHGLRKAMVARLAELGCTDREIMSISGHRNVAEVDTYASGVRRRKLAENVLKKNNVVQLRVGTKN